MTKYRKLYEFIKDVSDWDEVEPWWFKVNDKLEGKEDWEDAKSAAYEGFDTDNIFDLFHINKQAAIDLINQGLKMLGTHEGLSNVGQPMIMQGPGIIPPTS
jgi:hypothetical protein